MFNDLSKREIYRRLVKAEESLLSGMCEACPGHDLTALHSLMRDLERTIFWDEVYPGRKKALRVDDQSSQRAG